VLRTRCEVVCKREAGQHHRHGGGFGLRRCGQQAFPQRAYRADRGQATHPQGKPVDCHCEARACDHYSPTTAAGLTRFGCRTAVFVGVDAMQDKNKRSASVSTTDVLGALHKGCAPPAAGPAPLGRSPEESGAARQRVFDHDSRPCLLTLATKLATRSRWQLQPLHTETHKTVIPVRTCNLRHEAPGLRWIQSVGHGASSRSDDVGGRGMVRVERPGLQLPGVVGIDLDPESSLQGGARCSVGGRAASVQRAISEFVALVLVPGRRSDVAGLHHKPAVAGCTGRFACRPSAGSPSGHAIELA